MPCTMTRKRPQQIPVEPDESKKKDPHKHAGWMLRIPDVYKEQMAKSAKKNRRKQTEEAKIAFEEYLKNQGLWSEEEERRAEE